MGQLKKHRNAIFLSAGVPDPTAPHFVQEGDSAAIAAAVSALLYVTLGRRLLVWGGHPAITPMIWAFAKSMDVNYGEWVKLYQSNFFSDEFPEENAFFKNTIFTDAVPGNKTASLNLMRSRMIAETDFQAAVFIGGMEGILEEYKLFHNESPDAKILPIASTGGAAQRLALDIGVDKELLSELDYVKLLYHQLAIDPNEDRYDTPTEQPKSISNRIRAPKHGDKKH